MKDKFSIIKRGNEILVNSRVIMNNCYTSEDAVFCDTFLNTKSYTDEEKQYIALEAFKLLDADFKAVTFELDIVEKNGLRQLDIKNMTVDGVKVKPDESE